MSNNKNISPANPHSQSDVPLTHCIAAEFEGSFPEYRLLPSATLPEMTIVGRSNVGKSSLLNALANRKNLARVGKTPGVTRAMNVFRIVFRCEGKDIEFRLVDLPGYGFAKVSEPERRRWDRELEQYLLERESLELLLLLVDCRRDIEAEEEFFLNRSLPYPIHLIGTKRDQLKRAENPKWLAEGERRSIPITQVSVESRIGLEELRTELFRFLSSRSGG